MLLELQVHVHAGDLNSCLPDQEVGALTKWLASRMLFFVSRQVSLQCSLQYRIGTGHGLGLVEEYRLPWRRASESAGQVSLPVTCQAASVTQPDRLSATCQLGHDHVGVTNIED